MTILYIIIFLSLIFSAFFSGVEIAYITSNKLKIALDVKKGSRQAGIISKFLKKPSRFIGTLLLGNNITLVVFGMAMAKILEPRIAAFIANEMAILIVQTVLSTLLILVAGEFLPKALFRIDPNRILLFFAAPLFVVYYVLWIPSIIITGFSEQILKLFFKVSFSDNKLVFGRIDLAHYVKEITQGSSFKDGLSESKEQKEEIDYEIQIFQNALDFSSVKVRECMVPRTEMIAMDVENKIAELQRKFVETKLSKILIYHDSIDNIIGYAHAFEMFKKPQNIRDILLPLSVIPQGMSASDALKSFIKEKKSIAIVVDEFGGTSGLLTIEDVVEEIFGEIEDEHDTEQLIEKKISEHEFEFSARIEIDYLNDKYAFGFPKSDDYATLAGFILFISRDIPLENARIEYRQWLFRIKKVTAKRIELVNLTLKGHD